MSSRTGDTRQTTPLALVFMGLLACSLAEHLGYRDLVTIAVATNAAGLALLTQNRQVVTDRCSSDTTGTDTKSSASGIAG